jgi:dihydroorotate dehydrogenase (NAD+) catalytic subunit
MTPDLSTTVAGIKMANPIMTASGCCGYGQELGEIFPLSKLGALITKTITAEPRLGHPPPRTAEAASGMLNAIGLANVGIDRFIKEIMPFLERQKTKVIVNVGGARLSEYVEISARLAEYDRVDGIELNISCPNVDEGGMQIGHSERLAEQTVAGVKKVFPRPVIAKLSPNVTSIADIAKAVEQGGADAISLINTLIGTSIDIETWRPRLTNNQGGLSGPAIKPVALVKVNEVYTNCRLPVIGCGGISTWQDVVEFMLCGASAVEIGTALFLQPDTPVKIVKGLKEYLKKRKLGSISELIGKVRKY